MWHYTEPIDGVLQVRIDREGRPVNSFSTESMQALEALAEFVDRREDISAVVFASGKRGNFIAGADLYEIRENLNFNAILQMSQTGQRAFRAIESLRATTVAAISGVVLGGGLEFAMACDYRVAVDDPRTLAGLPEVHLGLMPGWGATVRLPGLVGFDVAVDMLLRGHTLNVTEAQDAGLIDQAVRASELDDVARTVALNGLTSRRVGRLDEHRARALLRQREQELTQTASAHYPAPGTILQVLRDGLGQDEEARYRLESTGIATLAAEPVTRELIRMFFLKETARKPPAGLRELARSVELRRVGVIADDEFGEALARLFVEREIPTDLAILSDDVAELEMASSEHLTRTTDVSDLGEVSVVLEAVGDDLDVERGLFQSLGMVIRPDTPIASTSSVFLLAEQARGVPHPERLLGLRFFYPPDILPFNEVARSAQTNDAALAAGFAVARLLGHHAILVNDSPGFLVDRVLLPMLVEAGHLLGELPEPEALNRAAAEFGMSLSPLALTDAIGIPTLMELLRRVSTDTGDHFVAPPVWRAIVDSPKSTGGILAEDGTVSGEVQGYIQRIQADAAPKDAGNALIPRLVYPLINAGAQCLCEHVVGSADDIDLALVLAGGFPDFRGGPMHYGEQLGLATVVDTLNVLAAESRAQLGPRDSLIQFASEGAFPRPTP